MTIDHDYYPLADTIAEPLCFGEILTLTQRRNLLQKALANGDPITFTITFKDRSCLTVDPQGRLEIHSDHGFDD